MSRSCQERRELPHLSKADWKHWSQTEANDAIGSKCGVNSAQLVQEPQGDVHTVVFCCAHTKTIKQYWNKKKRIERIAVAGFAPAAARLWGEGEHLMDYSSHKWDLMLQHLLRPRYLLVTPWNEAATTRDLLWQAAVLLLRATRAVLTHCNLELIRPLNSNIT